MFNKNGGVGGDCVSGRQFGKKNEAYQDLNSQKKKHPRRINLKCRFQKKRSKETQKMGTKGQSLIVLKIQGKATVYLTLVTCDNRTTGPIRETDDQGLSRPHSNAPGALALGKKSQLLLKQDTHGPLDK